MLPLSQLEIQMIGEELDQLQGARLQDIVLHEKGLGLFLFRNDNSAWLWLDSSQSNPFLLKLEKPPLGKKIEKPILLYARAHLRGHRLVQVVIESDLGRVLRLDFDGGFIRLILIPTRTNVEVHARDRSVFWHRPLELKPANENLSLPNPRTWDEIKANWRAGLDKVETKKVADPRVKIEKSFAKTKEDLARRHALPFLEIANWIKENQSIKVADAWAQYVDSKKSWQVNMKNLFEQARENRAKIIGQEARLARIQEELENLNLDKAKSPALKDTRKDASLLQKSEARGRTFRLHDLIAYMGKSAEDNLKILRKAQPFDLWMHLKDYPSAHVVVRRSKGRVVSDSELAQIGAWFIQNSLRKEAMAGRHEILVAECRFVRPIKGDKLGRVHYSNERFLKVSAKF